LSPVGFSGHPENRVVKMMRIVFYYYIAAVVVVVGTSTTQVPGIPHSGRGVAGRERHGGGDNAQTRINARRGSQQPRF